MTLKQNIQLTILLALILLIIPLVWMKIGPNGRAFYGPDVPDIYILGATILGKDRSFPGIHLAFRFQLGMILFFVFNSCMAMINIKRIYLVFTFMSLNLLLLLLFPFWLVAYVNGVVDNSDGAVSDLGIYPHVGIVVYVLLLWQVNKANNRARLIFKGKA